MRTTRSSEELQGWNNPQLDLLLGGVLDGVLGGVLDGVPSPSLLITIKTLQILYVW